MNGAHATIATLVGAGLDVCFANPGTTELPLLHALEHVNGMRAVLCLHEGVCTGAADGYARVAERPGLTMLHLGPGLANGLAYLHDARRAASPIVNLVGDHPTWHLPADPPLASDIESLAASVSVWVRRSTSGQRLPSDVVEAVAASQRPPGGIATLILAHDHLLEPATSLANPRFAPEPPAPSQSAVVAAATALREGGPVAVLLGGRGLSADGLQAAARIASDGRCRLMCDTFPARWERGVGIAVVERLPYFPEVAQARLSSFRSVILAGTRAPVAFFGYPGGPSQLLRGSDPIVLAKPDEDVVVALNALADEVGAATSVAVNGRLRRPGRPSGRLTPNLLCAAVASVLPEQAIVVDESNTAGSTWPALSQSCPAHTVLTQTGGAIGLGLPCATGAAIAAPDRPVVAPQADGSAMYTLQALWTHAREGLNVKTIICNNGAYRVLELELGRSQDSPGPRTKRLIEIAPPQIDWVSLARGLGVAAVRVETAEDLGRAFETAIESPGPALIDAIL